MNSEEWNWTTEDPIHAGTDWWAYCGNNPVNFTDLLGLDRRPTGTGLIYDTITRKYYDPAGVERPGPTVAPLAQFGANNFYSPATGKYYTDKSTAEYQDNLARGIVKTESQPEWWPASEEATAKLCIHEMRNDYEKQKERTSNLMRVQDSTRVNPLYQKGAVGPGNYENDPANPNTWCNVGTDDVVEATGFHIGLMVNENGRFWTGICGPNGSGDNLRKSTAAGRLKEVTPETAQLLGNLGYTVVASWDNDPNGVGHQATVRPDPGPYDPEQGPYISNIGEFNDLAYTKRAFAVGNGGAASLSDIHFYYDPNQTFVYNPALANRKYF